MVVNYQPYCTGVGMAGYRYGVAWDLLERDYENSGPVHTMDVQWNLWSD